MINDRHYLTLIIRIHKLSNEPSLLTLHQGDKYICQMKRLRATKIVYNESSKNILIISVKILTIFYVFAIITSIK